MPITSLNNYYTSTSTKSGNVWSITSPIGSSGWGTGVNISYFEVPYECWYEVSVELNIPTAHSIQVDVNNAPINGSAWNGNDNDNISNRGVIGSKSIAANT